MRNPPQKSMLAKTPKFAINEYLLTAIGVESKRWFSEYKLSGPSED